VSRPWEGSWITQRIRLAAGGAGDRVEVDTRIDWNTPATLLKAEFPLGARNPKATYDLGVGTIQRGNDTETLYEVPAQRWAAPFATHRRPLVRQPMRSNGPSATAATSVTRLLLRRSNTTITLYTPGEGAAGLSGKVFAGTTIASL